MFAQEIPHSTRAAAGPVGAAARGRPYGIRQESDLRGAGMLQQHHGTHHRAIGHGSISSDQNGGLRIAAQKRGGPRTYRLSRRRLIRVSAKIAVKAPAPVADHTQPPALAP